MLFNSWEFLFFALLIFPAYYRLRFPSQNWLLLVASYVFYGAWDYRFLLLLFGSTLLDYVVGLKIHQSRDPRRRRLLLLASCVGNLGALGFFKYFNFFVGSAEQALAAAGVPVRLLHLDLVLPVGISFYSFKALSYTVDIYRGQLEPTRSFRDFALFVSFFPQLVAGPIDRARNLLPQLTRPRRLTVDDVYAGGWLVTWGLFKKVVVADNLALVVDRAFAPTSGANGLEYLLALYAFAYQIYCDFSGYSDIARGLARLLGINLMVNFNRPYLARSPQEFWRRWHISLSTWLRDYLYFPLAGSLGGRLAPYEAIVLTMVLGGLWHGAAWTFVLWGAYHGCLLALEFWLTVDRGRRRSRSMTARALARVATFHLVCVGWLLFRSESLAQVSTVLSSFSSGFLVTPAAIRAGFLLVLCLTPLWSIESWMGNSEDARVRPGWRWGVGAVVVASLWLGIIILSPPAGRPFIYFQF